MYRGCGNNAIKVVVTSKMLGLDFNNNLTGKIHSKHIISKLSSNHKSVLKRYDSLPYTGGMVKNKYRKTSIQHPHAFMVCAETTPPLTLFCILPVIFSGNSTALKDVFTIPRTLLSGKCKENFLVNNYVKNLIYYPLLLNSFFHYSLLL
jgi:hypothetical protein